MRSVDTKQEEFTTKTKVLILLAVVGLPVFLYFSWETIAGTVFNVSLQRDNLDSGLVAHWTMDGEDIDLSSLGFDIATTSFIQSFDNSTQETSPRGIDFNPSGTKMFIVGNGSGEVDEYILSAAYDISTASFVDGFDVSGQDTVPLGLAFSSDGETMFVTGNDGDDINEYTCTVGYDVSSCSFVDSFDVSTQESTPTCVDFNPDGTIMYVCGNVGQDINEYSLNTGFDVSTASFDDTLSLGYSPKGLHFNNDGTRAFTVENESGTVREYSLSTAYDISTGSLVQSKDASSEIDDPEGLIFNDDGTMMYIVEGPDFVDNSGIYQYALSTGMDAVQDRSGNANHGDHYASTTGNIKERVISGKIGQALEFDGVDDYVNTNYDPAFSASDSFAVSLWFKSDNTSFTSDKAFFGSLESDDGLPQLEIEIDGDGSLCADDTIAIRLKDDSGSFTDLCSDYVVDNTEWHHLVYIYDDTDDQEIYIDSQLQNTATISGVDGVKTFTGTPFALGAFNQRGTINEFFDGTIDDVRTYDRALTEREITQLYHLGGTTKINTTITNSQTNSGLVGHWTFDGSDIDIAGNQITDVSGQGNHGKTLGQDTATTTAIGAIGQAFEFDGVDDRVEVAASSDFDFDLTRGFSVVAWVRADASAGCSGNDVAVSRREGTPNWWLGCLDSGDVGNFHLRDSASVTNEVSTSDSILDGEWHHLTGVFRENGSSDALELYLNGVLVDSLTDNYTGTGPDVNPVCIGAFGTSCAGNEWPGDIDDARIYDRALSAREVEQLYHLGGTTKVNTSIQRTGLDAGLVGHWTFDGADGFDLSSVPKALDRSGNSNDGFPYTEDDLVGYWSHDDEDVVLPDADVSTSTDRSGQGNDGTVDGATTGVSGKIGEAFDFDGVDDYVDTNYAPAFSASDSFAVSFWFKSDNTSFTQDRAFIGSKLDGNTPQFEFEIDGDGSLCADDTIVVRLVDDDGGGTPDLCSGYQVNDTEWHHSVYIYDDTDDMEMYIDGELQNSADFTGADGAKTFTGVPFAIGAFNSNGTINEFFDGTIDDVRFYTRALSASEVEDLYNLKAGTGQKVTSGKIGQGLEFDGVDDVVAIDAAQGPQSAFTASVWIKPTDESGTEMFFGQWAGTETAYAQFFALENSVRARIHQGTGSIWIGREATAVLEGDTWQHYVFTWDGGTTSSSINIYKNGVQVDDTDNSNNPGSFSGPETDTVQRCIGAQGPTCLGASFEGTIDDVRTYDRALSEREIEQLYLLGQ